MIQLGVLSSSERIYHRAKLWAANGHGACPKVRVVADSSEDVEDFMRECVVDLYETRRPASGVPERCEVNEACFSDANLPLPEPVLQCLAWAQKHPDTVLRIQL
mmetsp:Transcript_7633/g.13846  ORF Transcript_7633/g.13846 Transcript_7633/m.13846 type:complete len:104 (-) Transcript_7633:115-426(-)